MWKCGQGQQEKAETHSTGQMDLSADLCYNFLLNDVLGDVFYDTE